MPNWKKVIISGSNISQLTNDSGYVLADQVSGSSTLPISNLSASLTTTDQIISSSVAALSGSASTRRDVMYSQLEFMNVSLSGSSSASRNTLSRQVSGSFTEVSASLTTTDQIISASVAALSGSASDARNALTTTSASYALTASYSHTASYAAISQHSITTNEIVVNVKNTSGGSIAKGVPVYATGVTGDNINISIASNLSSNTMPAIGVLGETLGTNASGTVVVSGKIIGVDTAGFTAGQNIYVNSNGDFTQTKPTGSGFIQNIGVVGKVNSTEGEILIQGSGRSNDLPNLESGHVWVGDGDGVPTAVLTSSLSASYALTASYAISSSHEITHEVSSSYAQTATSASYALTASYALNGGGGSGFPAEYVTSNTTAEKNKTYVFETSTAYTLTLPSTPTDGDSIQISNRSNIGTNVLGRNGELIMGDANDLTLDLATASFILTYAGGNQGWVIIGAGGGATTGSAESVWYDGGTFLSSSVDVRITGSLSMVGSEANFETLQIVLPEISQSGNFADDTAAAIGGIALGGLYRNGNLIAIRLS